MELIDMWPFRRKPAPAPVPELKSTGVKWPPLGSHRGSRAEREVSRWRERMAALSAAKPHVVTADGRTIAMDESLQNVKALNNAGGIGGMPEMQFDFFASYGFIGHQTAAFMAQHWLIKKVCFAPAEDAVRNGYKITFNGNDDIGPEVIDAITTADKRMSINKAMREYIGQGNIFGIRIAIYLVDTPDPDKYYANPFNPDAIRPGAYRGMSQVDPYWCLPELDLVSASDPASQSYYEPTWWRIGGRRYHRSHLCIYRTVDLPDVLKPAYIYGGIPVPQLISERVYGAERTANEGPKLALTKRLRILKTDVDAALLDEDTFRQKIDFMVSFADNHGFLICEEEQSVDQKDTALGDFDALTQTLYQLVAAAGEVPATKLLGTSPKGFSATGEYDEGSYHERLAGIQENGLTPLLDGHHLRLWRSEIAPKFGLSNDIAPCVSWNPLDEMTAVEQADLNLKKAQTDQALAATGAIDGTDIRERLIADPDSGHNGMVADIDPAEEELPNGTPQAPSF